jgi:hypothetical protein
MKQWKVVYISSNDNDSCSIWVWARDEEHAEEVARDEFWDIDRICQISLL